LCECAAGFEGKECEKELPAGEIINRDPSTEAAKGAARAALGALNQMRAKIGKPKLFFKNVINYQTQQIAGTKHTLCIETNAAGFLKLGWDEAADGASHLTTVLPLHQSIKWLKEPTIKFACTKLPYPYDPRAPEDRGPVSLLLETEAGARNKNKKVSMLLASKAELRGLPTAWDARHDHPRSAKCKGVVEHAYNQGTCGSCYAFAAMGTASIRACLAGHDISDTGFSVQDMLACGTNWEGDFQNKVAAGHKGTRFAGNCDGHFSANVFEYATKYGLLDESCQHYAHVGDPLTHFDDDAGAQVCLLENSGGVALPEVDVWNRPSKDYAHFMKGVQSAVFGTPQKTLTAPQAKEIRRILTSKYPSYASRDDAGILSLYRGNPWTTAWLGPKDKLVRMTLAAPIGAGETVSVDSMAWCNRYHPSNKHGMDNVVSEKASEPSCIGKLAKDIHDGTTVKAPGMASPLSLAGERGALIGGLDNKLCTASVDRLQYSNGNVGAGSVKFHQLGSNALGECHRDRSGAFHAPAGHQACGKVHNVFHSPVKVKGNTQSERVMMQAIMDGGAISASFATTGSFMHFDGKGVYDMEAGEQLDGGHAIVLFGWGEENGKKFWWGKNSWGPGPAAIFKFARGRDVATIESRSASWLSVDGPHTPHNTNVALPTSNARGFCEDALLDESLLADRSKIDNACVKVTCNKSGEAKCFLEFSNKCPKDKMTVVTLNADSSYSDIKFNRPVRVALKTKTACIENVRVE
jgi:hypothetical protein